MAVLVDSSIWIAGANPKNKECLTLRRLIDSNELLYVTRIIQVEVCQGARTEEEFSRLWDAFLGFEFLEVTTRHWGMSAWNFFRLRKKGKTLTTVDCLIGTLSAEYGVPLWTLDKTLRDAHSVIGFERYSARSFGCASG